MRLRAAVSATRSAACCACVFEIATIPRSIARARKASWATIVSATRGRTVPRRRRGRPTIESAEITMTTFSWQDCPVKVRRTGTSSRINVHATKDGAAFPGRQVPPSHNMVTPLVMTNEDGIWINGTMFMNLYVPETVTVIGSPGTRLLTGVETPWCVPVTVTVQLLKSLVSPAMYAFTILVTPVVIVVLVLFASA